MTQKDNLEQSPTETTSASEVVKTSLWNNFIPTERDFEGKTDEEINKFLSQIYADYQFILKDMHSNAELSNQDYQKFSKSGRRWRFWLIWVTGIVAILNTSAALGLFGQLEFKRFLGWELEEIVTVAGFLTVVAAVVAVLATVLGNIENFFSYSEQAARRREAREMYFAVYWKYHSRWKFYVIAYGATGKACANASSLYSELVEEFVSIRKNVGELSKRASKISSASDSGGAR